MRVVNILSWTILTLLLSFNHSYAQTRVESQGWWIPNFGHLHLAANVPLGQVIHGGESWDVRIVLHDNPSQLLHLKLSVDGQEVINQNLSNTCPYDGVVSSTCAWAFSLDFDTNTLQDGWRRFDIDTRAKTPDNKNMNAGIRFFADVDNGGIPVDNSQKPSWTDTRTRGQGWHRGFYPSRAFIDHLPLEPLHGQVKFRFSYCCPEDERIVVELDKTHHIPAVGSWAEQVQNNGEVLYDITDGPGPLVTINLDTTLLNDGWHSLAMRNEWTTGGTSNCSFCNGEENVSAGVIKFWFYVDNNNHNQGVFEP